MSNPQAPQPRAHRRARPAPRPSRPSISPPSTCPGPARIHVVGVGGAGMSAIATVLAAMGHHGVRQRPQGVAPASSGCGPWGVDVARRPRRRQPRRAPTSSPCPPPSPTPTPRCARPAQRGIPVLRRAEILAAICAARRTVAVAGTHGKTTTSSMLALVLGRGGPAARRSSSAATSTRSAPGRCGTRASWFVVEADESDGTFLELPRRGGLVTNVEADHLDHYGGVRRRCGPPSTASWPAARGPRWSCVDEPWAPSWPRGPAPAVEWPPTAPAEAPTTASPTCERRPGSARRSTLERRGEPLGRGRAARARRPQRRATPPPPPPWPLELGRAVRAPPRRPWPASPAWPGASQFRGEAGGVTFIDDYAHLPTEVRGRAGRRRGPAAGAGSWPCSSPTATAASTALWRRLRRRLRRRRPRGRHRRLRGRRDAPARRHRQARRRRRARRPPVAAGGLPAPPGRPGRLPGRELRPGDLCLTLGAGDLTSLPDELLAALRARGRGEPPGDRSPAAEARPCDAAARLARADASRSARCTTYRVGGPAGARSAGVADDLDDLLAACRRRRRHRRRRARGRPGLEPAGGRRRLRRAGRRRWARPSPRVEVDGDAGARRRRRPPAGRGPPHRRRRGLRRLRVGGRRARLDRRRGAHERRRPRLRPGRQPAWRSERRRPARAAGDVLRCRPPTSTSATGPRPCARPARGRGRAAALAPGDPDAGPGPLIDEIVRWRRANQPGGPNAGSVFTNPPGDSAGRLIDAAGGQGPAGRHRPRSRPSTPTSSRPTPAARADDVHRPDGRGPAPGPRRRRAGPASRRPCWSASRPRVQRRHAGSAARPDGRHRSR